MINMQEIELYYWWQSFSEAQACSHDNRLLGISPGFLNTSEGPDFESAEFRLDGIVYRGDVEIHIRLSDWRTHGHHLDPRYDRVMLHLIWEDIRDKDAKVFNSRGAAIKTISFTGFPKCRIKKVPALCLRIRKPNDRLLRRLSFDRFLQQGRSLAKRKAGDNRDQALYQQILYLIGKPGNSHPFKQLGEILSWQDLMMMRKRYHLSPEGWHYLFMRLAGLASIDRSHPEEHLLPALPFRKEVWAGAGHRPQNRPGNRLYGLACFVAAMPSVSLRLTWQEVLGQRLPVKAAIEKLVAAHRTPGGKGWGNAQVLEIIGNIILPYFYVEAVADGSNGFADYIVEVFYNLPRASPYGRLKVFRPVYENSYCFYRDQAYLHVYNHYCRYNNCRTCPLRDQVEID